MSSIADITYASLNQRMKKKIFRAVNKQVLSKVTEMGKCVCI